MACFRLIDLSSQAAEVARQVAGWPKPKILGWLAWHGEVTSLAHLRDPDCYLFRAPAGVATAFRLTDSELTILGDHTAVRHYRLSKAQTSGEQR